MRAPTWALILILGARLASVLMDFAICQLNPIQAHQFSYDIFLQQQKILMSSGCSWGMALELGLFNCSSSCHHKMQLGPEKEPQARSGASQIKKKVSLSSLHRRQTSGDIQNNKLARFLQTSETSGSHTRNPSQLGLVRNVYKAPLVRVPYRRMPNQTRDTVVKHIPKQVSDSLINRDFQANRTPQNILQSITETAHLSRKKHGLPSKKRESGTATNDNSFWEKSQQLKRKDSRSQNIVPICDSNSFLVTISSPVQKGVSQPQQRPPGIRQALSIVGTEANIESSVLIRCNSKLDSDKDARQGRTTTFLRYLA